MPLDIKFFSPYGAAKEKKELKKEKEREGTYTAGYPDLTAGLAQIMELE